MTAARPSAVPGLFADPDLLVHDGRYWLYPTTDGVPDWGATTFSVLSSPDLVSWTDHGVVLDLADVAWASGHAWAPAILHRDGRFLLYFTADTGAIGVAVADSPLGPFRDIGRPLVADGDFSGRAIDPSLLVDRDGTVHLYWGNGVAHGVALHPDLISFDPSTVVEWVPEGFCEAAWVHRRGDVYYHSWSVDDTRSADYHVEYATGPGPTGPWTHRGTLLRKRPGAGILGTGHHAIVQVPGSDDWIVASHRFAVPDGDGFHREIAFDRLHHRDDGTLAEVIPDPTPLLLPLATTDPAPAG
jgi:beta-xylosidase